MLFSEQLFRICIKIHKSYTEARMAENRRVRMTKKIIKDALLELLDQKPLDKITVTDICNTADLNRSTFYAHYEDATQVLREIEADVMQQLPMQSDYLTAENSEKFLTMLTDFFRYIRENETLFRILLLKTGRVSFNQRLAATIMGKYHKQNLIRDSLIERYQYIYCVNGALELLKEWVDSRFPIDERKFAEFLWHMSMQASSPQNIEL